MRSHIPLQENETVLHTFRKHWFILVAELLPIFVAFLLPFLLYGFLSYADIEIQGQSLNLSLSGELWLFAGSLWALFVWMKIAASVTHYYLDAWMVTGEHLIDIEQWSLFHRQTSVSRIDRIQDITVETPGFIATVFHFGDIHVQTAGAEREFVMRGIANPKFVREAILRQQDTLFHKNGTVPDQEVTKGVEA